MIDRFKQIINSRASLLEISLNNTFAEQLCEYDSRPFNLADSTFFGIPCVIRLNQRAPFLITIQGGKK
jgi:hypothetical protein